MKISDLEKIFEEFLEKYNLERLKVSVRKDGIVNGKDRFVISVSAMYEYVNFDFEFLELISNTMKTKKINFEDDREHYGGCDTCNYGSQYIVHLYVHEAGIELEDA